MFHACSKYNSARSIQQRNHFFYKSNYRSEKLKILYFSIEISAPDLRNSSADSPMNVFQVFQLQLRALSTGVISFRKTQTKILMLLVAPFADPKPKV